MRFLPREKIHGVCVCWLSRRWVRSEAEIIFFCYDPPYPPLPFGHPDYLSRGSSPHGCVLLQKRLAVLIMRERGIWIGDTVLLPELSPLRLVIYLGAEYNRADEMETFLGHFSRLGQRRDMDGIWAFQWASNWILGIILMGRRDASGVLVLITISCQVTLTI